jgi:predicted transcriptional regulator
MSSQDVKESILEMVALRAPHGTRRSRVEIYMDILNVVNGPSLPTNIMYRTNLSWKPLQACLAHLKDLGLIKEYNGPIADRRIVKAYERTPEGEKMLNAYRSILEGLGSPSFLIFEEVRAGSKSNSIQPS